MSNIVNIIDFQHIYYKYKNTVMSGRIKRLTNASGEDITVKYFVLKEIERISEHGKVDTAICFESKTNKRKEQSEDYKAKRVKTLDSSDYDTIAEIREILSECGYKTLCIDGYEADDLVATLANKYSDVDSTYDEVRIYTIDNDLIQLVNGKVCVYLYKIKRGYSGYIRIDINNFDIVSELFGTYIPYNTVMLYKCTVGDKSDNINGIKGFGVSAFEKMISEMECTKAPFYKMNTYIVVSRVLQIYFINNLNDTDKYNQALESLKLVEMQRYVPGVDFAVNKIDMTNKNEIYNKLEMPSLAYNE